MEELMWFKEELTLSLLCKQTGRATRPLSPLKMKDAFQFVPTDENNHKVTILQMLIVFKFTLLCLVQFLCAGCYRD